MEQRRSGNAGSMHQLGYELPERRGFGGLWESVAEAAGPGHRTAGDLESDPEVVAHCDGASSSATRRAIDAFRRICCDVDTDVDTAA